MKYTYKVTYEQKFGGKWFEYTDNVIGDANAIGVVNKVQKRAINQKTLDEKDCQGFRLVSVIRGESVNY